MDKLTELLASLGTIDAKLDALLEGTNELTEEQRATHDALLKDRDKTLRAITAEKARAAREAERTKLAAEAEAAKEETEERAAEEARRKAQADEKRKRAEIAAESIRLSTPDLPTVSAPAPAPAVAAAEAIPARVRRMAGSIKNFRGVVDGRPAQERAYRFGMFCLAMLHYQMPGRYRFQNAADWYDRNLAANKSNDSLGAQYLIPEEFSADLIDLREVYGVARRLFKIERMTTDTKLIPRRSGGLTANFYAEGAVIPESNKTWDQIRLVAKDLGVISRWTNQVNADAVINFGDDLAGEIAYSFTNKEDDCAFNGNGTSTYGGIQGVRFRLQNFDAAAGGTTDSVGLITGAGNSWGALTLANFLSVIGILPQYAAGPRCCWVMHRAFYYNVLEKLILAGGGVTGLEVRTGETAPRPLVLGYPVEFSQLFPATSASGSVVAAFGDFMQGATFGDRQMDSIAFSEHATISVGTGFENVFERNEIAIRGTERFDINVHDVGDAVTPGPIVGLTTA